MWNGPVQGYSNKDRCEFRAYCRQVTDAQVFGIWKKETRANRLPLAADAYAEAVRRGLDTSEWDGDAVQREA